MCRQHDAMHKCQARGCTEWAVRMEGDWWFCREHAPLWRAHNRIVARILAMPVRK